MGGITIILSRKVTIMSGQTDEQIIEAASKAVTVAMELAGEEEGWKVEKEQGESVVKSKKNKEGRKVWLCTAKVNVSPDFLWNKIQDTDNVCSWNSTVTQSKVLKKISEDVKVTYQVTSEGGGGMVSARDFVYGAKTLVVDDKRVVGGLSVMLEDNPEVKGIVRAIHGPGCQMVIDTGDKDRCEFIWLMDCDYRGMIPTSIVEIAMPLAQLQMIECINKLAE